MKTLTFFLAIISSISFAQINKASITDSLKIELSKAKNDTTKVLIYAQLVAYRLPMPRAEKIEFGQKGYDLAKKIHFEKGIILCGNDLGFIMIEKDYFKSLPILFDVKKICEKNKDTTNLVVSIGYLAYAHNKFNVIKALYYYRICLNLMQKAHISERIMPIYTAMGYAFKDKGDLDSALIYLKKGYQSSLTGNSPIPVSSYGVHFGEIYYKKGNIPVAKQYLKKSIVLTNETNVLGQSFYFLAKIYQEQNKLDSAKYFAKQSLMYEQKYDRSVYLINSSQLLYDLYKNTDTQKALHYLEISSMTKDSLFSQEKERQVEKMAFEERERETITQRRIEAHKLDFENKIKIYILIGILLGLGIFAFVLYRNNNQKHQANIVLKEQKEEIESTLSKLKATQNQLFQSEKLASLGELTAGIAHEIQNPLNFVNNFSEMSVELAKELKDEVEKPEMDKALIIELANDLAQNQEKITHHGKRASSIVKGMLEHSRTNTGIKELTDINKMADEFLRLAYHGLRAKDKGFNADFKTDFEVDLPRINVVPQDIGRVMLNLISNAFYAVGKKENERTETKGSFNPMIVVSTKSIDNQIIISIKDNGMGMSEATKAKIFQPFFTTKPTGEGTGLGLSLSYDIIKAHGGELKVESKEGVFTEFTIILPQ
jgi:two-component system, NtrC family, sensor kinase